MKKSCLLFLFLFFILVNQFDSINAQSGVTFHSETPYPLYLPLFGPEAAFNRLDLEKIAENFDMCFGNPPLPHELEYIKSINPDFKAVRYIGVWVNNSLRRWYSLNEFEKELQDAMLYYKAGTLDHEISKEDTMIYLRNIEGELKTGNAHPDSIYTYETDGKFYYHTILRIDDEMMGIMGFRNDSVIVSRGFFDTQPASHTSGASVSSPLYYTEVNSTRERFAYMLDPSHPVKWRFIATRCMEEMQNNKVDGVWIDILGTTTLRSTRMDGSISYNYWYLKEDKEYSRELFRKESENGIDFIQDTVKKVVGEYPVLYGNNMTASQFDDGVNDRYKYLVPTEEKPRPIDGYCIEDAWGKFTPEQWIRFNEYDEFIYPEKATLGDHSYMNWEKNLVMLMKCGERGLAGVPQMINAGMKNEAFEYLSEEERHDWYIWAYASYLLGVVVEEDSTIVTKQGITALMRDDDKRFIDIDPCLQWEIGIPEQTFSHDQLDNYKVTDKTYLRRSSNGIVMVNPHQSDDNEVIDLESYGGPYTDPDMDSVITAITMPAQSGKILLLDYDSTQIPDYENYPYQGKPYLGEPFTIPSQDSMWMYLFDVGEFNETVFDPDHHPDEYYMPNMRFDNLDSMHYVELRHLPPLIIRVSEGEWWRYSIRVNEPGFYSTVLYYGGTSPGTYTRKIKMTLYDKKLNKKEESTREFLFGQGIQNHPLVFDTLNIDTGDYVLEWKALYSGARPDLDYFKIPRIGATEIIEYQDITNINVVVFPNPAGRSIGFTNIETPCELVIHDLQGKIVLKYILLTDNQLLNIDHLNNGLYIYKLKLKRRIITGKFIKYNEK